MRPPDVCRQHGPNPWDEEAQAMRCSTRELSREPAGLQVPMRSLLYGKEPPSSGHALQVTFASVSEPYARAADQVDNRPRHQYFAGWASPDTR